MEAFSIGDVHGREIITTTTNNNNITTNATKCHKPVRPRHIRHDHITRPNIGEPIGSYRGTSVRIKSPALTSSPFDRGKERHI